MYLHSSLSGVLKQSSHVIHCCCCIFELTIFFYIMKNDSLFLVFLVLWGEPADPDMTQWGYAVFPNMRINVKIIVLFLGFLWFRDESAVALFGSGLVFLFQYKDLVELTNASKRLIQKYEEMRDFRSVFLKNFSTT